MKYIITLALVLFALVSTMTSAHATSQQDDKAAIASKMQLWVSAWNVGTGDFNPNVFETLFMPGKDAISVFDNVQGDVLTLSSLEQYMSTWGPFMEPLPVWRVKLEDFSIKVSGDMAFATFRLVGTETKAPDGSDFPFGQYGTHVWHKTLQGEWFIVHEHLTAYDTKNPAHDG